MAFNIFDKTRMTVTNSGTGARSLSSITGFTTFADAFGATTTDIPYTLEYGDDWEVGFGTFDNGTGQFTATSVDATFVSGVIDKSPASSLNLPAGGGGAVLFISPNVAFTQKIVDGTPVGQTTPAAGSFTTLNASGNATVVGQLVSGGATQATGSISNIGGSVTFMDINGGVHRVGAYNWGTSTWEDLNLNSGALVLGGAAKAFNATFVGAVNIPEFLQHDGDTDTRLWFLPNRLILEAGGQRFFDAQSGGLTVDGAGLGTSFGGPGTFAGDVDADTFKPASYLVSTAPSPSVKGAGAHTFITDEVGGPTGAYSDGTNWRRYSDRAIIST